MSIWSSWREIGQDFDNQPTGTVLSWANGWSNHYPDPAHGPERPASVSVAHIPAWCVPGHHDDTERAYGPWLRLWVNSWSHDWASGGKAITGPEVAAVVLDEDAVRALRDDLTEWLDAPKAYPAPVSTEETP